MAIDKIIDLYTCTTSTSLVTKTVHYTIGKPGDTTTNYTWTSAANVTEQNIEITGLLPKYARIISSAVFCTETVAGGMTDFKCSAGPTSGATTWFGNNTCKTEHEAHYGSTVDGNETASVVSGWVNGTPTGANWSTMSAGMWSVYITYVDHIELS